MRAGQITLKQVICIKWGNRYGAEYVNRLYAMVERNITPPFRVYCFTDDARGIREDVTCFDLPPLGCPTPTNAPGKWRKIALWNRDLNGLSGTALFVDLDVVITRNLDPFFAFGDADDVVLARNPIKPFERLGQTSVFRFPIGRYHQLLDDFRADPQTIAGHFQFEQRYVTQRCPRPVKFWPRRWVRHFRHHCLGPWPLRYFRPARLPRDARMVIFPGKPDPADALAGRWSGVEPHVSRFEHLRRAFTGPRSGSSVLRHLKRYVMPSPWISEHWRE